jgi:Fur family ferric uptake transcriptional regulator
MSHHELGYEAHLHQHGYRLTPQREIILDAVCAAGTHTSFDEIRERVQKHSSAIDRSTIYRALDFLTEQGIVLRADLGHGNVLYEIAHTTPHHHLVCQRCGSVTDLDNEIVQDLFVRIERQHGFEPHMDHLVVRGLCRMCAHTDAEDE